MLLMIAGAISTINPTVLGLYILEFYGNIISVIHHKKMGDVCMLLILLAKMKNVCTDNLAANKKNVTGI